MVRTEAQKRAQKKYREKADKYENIKRINRESNKKRYHEDPELRQRKINQMKEYHLARKLEIIEKEELEEEEIISTPVKVLDDE